MSRKQNNNRKIGTQQEKIASEYLISQGYTIINHNFYSRTGEIDMIARNEGYLVFIEVKYRKDERLGTPEEAVHPRKIQSIVNTALYYRARYHISDETPCRFDVVAITGTKIQLIKDAFEM